MTMKPQEERAVAACEILLETVNGIEDACQKAGVPFSQEQYCQMFALAYTLLSRRMAGAVTREFALLALAGTMGAEDQGAAQQLSDLFTAALARCEGGAGEAGGVSPARRGQRGAGLAGPPGDFRLRVLRKKDPGGAAL